MNDVIICPNQECKAENPANAKFCRMCKHPLSTSEDEYTPNLFPDITLRPVAVMPIRFINILERGAFVLLPLLIIFLYFICGDYKREFKDEFGNDAFDVVSIGGIIFSVLFALLCINGIKHYIRYSSYSENADYIEEAFFMQKLKRIAKDKKLGLFDNKNKVVLLNPSYDSISKFDDVHIQLEKNNKFGLYSIPLRKIIIPIEYDGIAPVQNGVVEVVKDSHGSHYDIQGNVLK